MSIETLITFTVATVVLLAIPGPTILLVISYALAKGRSIAFAVVGGVILGDLLAMTATIFGLGILLETSATLFIFMKWIGAVYLAWMGWRMIRTARKTTHEIETVAAKSHFSAFKDSAIVTFFNPKSIGFFVAFVPQFVDTSLPSEPQFATMIMIFVGLGGINALVYAMLAAQIRQRITHPKIFSWIQRLGGSILLGLAMFTVTLKKV